MKREREYQLYAETFGPGVVSADKALLAGVLDRSSRIDQRGRGISRIAGVEYEWIDVRVYVKRAAEEPR